MSNRHRHGGQLHIASEESERVSDRDAQSYNVEAARAVARAVGTTLGPGGLEKMLVDSTGEVVITNDGETILSSMEIGNPTGRMLADIAHAQADRVGDGTATAMVLAGTLLDNAEQLLERGVHPHAIARGHEYARRQAVKTLSDLGRPVDADDTETLRAVAETALTGNATAGNRAYLGRCIVDAIQQTVTDRGPDLEWVDTKTEAGALVAESEVFEGAVYDRERLHSDMPVELPEARVLFLKGEATLEPEIPGDERKTAFQVESPADLEAVHETEDRHRHRKIDRIIDAGVNCVFCEKGIDDGSQQYLADAGILALRRIEPSDLRFFQRVLGGTVLTHLDDVGPEDIGHGSITRNSDGERLYIRGETPSAVTLLLQAPTESLAEELDRAVADGLRAVEHAIIDGTVVPGAGASEIELARRLRSEMAGIQGREQLGVESVIDALETVPRTIVDNAGSNGLEAVADLRSAHEAGRPAAGWETGGDAVVDAHGTGIVGPTSVKKQAVSSAVEAANLVLRIDDIIAATDLETVPDDD